MTRLYIQKKGVKDLRSIRGHLHVLKFAPSRARANNNKKGRICLWCLGLVILSLDPHQSPLCSASHANQRSLWQGLLAPMGTCSVPPPQERWASSSGGCSARAKRQAPPSRAVQTLPLYTCLQGRTHLDASCSWNRTGPRVAYAQEEPHSKCGGTTYTSKQVLNRIYIGMT